MAWLVACSRYTYYVVVARGAEPIDPCVFCVYLRALSEHAAALRDAGGARARVGALGEDCESDVLLAVASIAQTNTSALAASIGGEQARLLGSLRVVGGGTFELRGRALPPVVEQVQMIG